MAKVGKQIRQLRIQNKMTQDELADKLFVSRQTVSNYENGKSNPDLDMLMKLAEILDTDVNTLLYGIPVSPDKKKERKRLIISASLLLILYIFYYWYGSFARKWLRDYLDPALQLNSVMVFFPILMLLSGFVLFQAAAVFCGAKSLKIKWKKYIHYTLLAIIIIYGIIVLPFCIDNFIYAREQYVLHQQWLLYGQEYSTDQITHILPDAWYQLVMQIMNFFAYLHPRNPSMNIFYIFWFIIGIGLWCTKPDSNSLF